METIGRKKKIETISRGSIFGKAIWRSKTEQEKCLPSVGKRFAYKWTILGKPVSYNQHKKQIRTGMSLLLIRIARACPHYLKGLHEQQRITCGGTDTKK